MSNDHLLDVERHIDDATRKLGVLLCKAESQSGDFDFDAIDKTREMLISFCVAHHNYELENDAHAEQHFLHALSLANGA